MRRRESVSYTSEDVNAFLSLEEAKVATYVTHAHEDGLLQRLILPAVLKAEDAGRISILPRTFELTVRTPYLTSDNFSLVARSKDPDRIATGIRLPLARPDEIVESVHYVKHDKTIGRELTAGTDFDVNRGVIEWTPRFRFDSHMPEIRVIYRVGISRDSNEYDNLRIAVEEILSTMFENRGHAAVKIPSNARMILNSYWSSPTYRRG